MHYEVGDEPHEATSDPANDAIDMVHYECGDEPFETDDGWDVLEGTLLPSDADYDAVPSGGSDREDGGPE
eukprot:2337624-Pyramimonas_sp.AAC.1